MELTAYLSFIPIFLTMHVPFLVQKQCLNGSTPSFPTLAMDENLTYLPFPLMSCPALKSHFSFRAPLAISRVTSRPSKKRGSVTQPSPIEAADPTKFHFFRFGFGKGSTGPGDKSGS